MMNDRLSSIPKAVIDCVTESMAREHLIIPIEASDDCITIATAEELVPMDFPALCDVALLQDELEFVLECNVRLERHPAADIRAAIDKYYSYEADIKNCESAVETECPRIWFNLQQTDDEHVRYCDTCSRKVFYCKSEASELRHIQLGHSVAVYTGPRRIEM